MPKNQCFISHTKVSGSTVVFKVFKLVNEFMEIVCKVWFFCDTKANANFSVGAWYHNQHFLKYSNTYSIQSDCFSVANKWSLYFWIHKFGKEGD